MDDIFDFSPKLRIFVGFEHLIWRSIGKDTIDMNAKVYGEDDSDGEQNPKVNGIGETADLYLNEGINAAEN